MTCEKFAQMLDNYENLTDEEKALMSEHASECEECGRELKFMRSVINSVKTLPEMKVPDDFLKKLNERIDTREKPRKRSFVSHMRYNWQKYSAAAACLVIAAVIGSNYDTLINRMNGDDGVISEVTTAYTSPVPGAPTAAPKPQSTAKAGPLDNGTVIGDVAGRINSANSANKTDEKKTDTDTAAENPVMSSSGFSSRVQSRGGFSSGGTSSAPGSSGTASSSTRTQRGTSGGSSALPASGSGYTSPQITVPAAEPEANHEDNQTNMEPQADLETQAPADGAQASAEGAASGSASDVQTVTLPRGVYVEARGGGEDSAEAAAEETENGINSYSISDPEEGYAAADTRNYDDGGYDDESEDDDDGPGYELNQINMIVVRGEDFATAFDIICQYASDSYSNYFMVTSDNIDAMLGALDEAGVYYQDNIAVDTDKITFRISVG